MAKRIGLSQNNEKVNQNKLFIIYYDMIILMGFQCNELQDIHYQGRELKEAPAPIGYH